MADRVQTYNSQTTYILKTSDSTALYFGDRWISSNLPASTYIWLPLTISGTSVSMKNFVSWVPTTDFAAWQSPPSENSYEGEKAVYGGQAKTVSCGKCSGGTAAGYIGGPDNGGSVTFSGVHSDIDGLTTIRIKFLNGDTGARYANVRVNGDAGRKVAFLQATGDPASSTLHAELKKGDGNVIVIEGIDGGWGPDVDRLMVPVK